MNSNEKEEKRKIEMEFVDNIIKKNLSNKPMISEDMIYGRQLNRYPKRIDKKKILEHVNKEIAKQKNEMLDVSEYEQMK